MSHDPMEQFQIHDLIQLPSLLGINVNITNSGLFMIMAVVITSVFGIIATRSCDIIPGRMQMTVEAIYNLTKKIIVNAAGEGGLKYFPTIFSLFLYVMSCNLLGLMPYGFTVTSHIIVTFAMAAFVIAFITLAGLMRHGLKFFKVFLPPGTPWWMMPLMIFIEIFAYFSRSASLSIRLAANMVAGHTMLKVVAGFITSIGMFAAFMPFTFLMAINALELFVALLQAYIFTILSCVYLDSVLNIH